MPHDRPSLTSATSLRTVALALVIAALAACGDASSGRAPSTLDALTIDTP